VEEAVVGREDGVASEEGVAGAEEEDSKVEATKDERSRRREARSLEDIYPLCVFFDIMASRERSHKWLKGHWRLWI
jgi:hypothetical protein